MPDQYRAPEVVQRPRPVTPFGPALARFEMWRWIGTLCLLTVLQSCARADAIDFRLSKIDEGVTWVSGYWGYNAPKLVFDGQYYYTVGGWGDAPNTSEGVIYRFDGNAWERGYEWSDLDYQPGMLLLDEQGRLILIYPKPGAKPRILRANQPGDFNNFTALNVTSLITQAGYIGAGIKGNKLVIGYIGGPDTYSFYTAVLNLDTQQWSNPIRHAIAQQSVVPYTAWLYPVIKVEDDGFHILVSNAATGSTYDRVMYSYVPFSDTTPLTPEIVEEVFIPPNWRIAFGMAMWVAQDGAIYVTAQHNPDPGNMLRVYRRDPVTETWSGISVSTSQVAAIFQGAQDPENLWLMSTFGSALRLYRSDSDTSSWELQSLPSFAEYDFVSSFFLHGINPGSGSVMPEVPTAVFSAGTHPNYELWFVQFNTLPETASPGDLLFLH